jgi:hypothetical protein
LSERCGDALVGGWVARSDPQMTRAEPRERAGRAHGDSVRLQRCDHAGPVIDLDEAEVGGRGPGAEAVDRAQAVLEVGALGGGALGERDQFLGVRGGGS